jgi:hypothetical protein
VTVVSQHSVCAPDEAPVCAIFCGPSAIAAVELALSLYAEAELTMPIEVIAPARCSAALRKVCPSDLNVQLLSDEDLPGHAEALRELERRADALQRRGRSARWYLQQYLKMARAWHAERRVFIHDGDTVFAPRLLEELAFRPQLLTTREQVSTYNDAQRQMGLASHERSFIANGGLFEPALLRRLADEPLSWILQFLDHAVLTEHGGGDFSEYQIMGSLILRERGWPEHPLRLFRRLDLLVSEPMSGRARVKGAWARYDAVAFETVHHTSVAKRVAARAAWILGHSW